MDATNSAVNRFRHVGKYSDATKDKNSSRRQAVQPQRRTAPAVVSHAIQNFHGGSLEANHSAYNEILNTEALSTPSAQTLTARLRLQARRLAVELVAMLLSDLGESVMSAQAQLGHARLGMAAKIYTHVVPASQRAAIERLERAVWPQFGPKWTHVGRTAGTTR